MMISLVLLGIFILLLLVAFLRFMQRVWWRPIRIQRIMRSQGIKGPSYRFFYGNTKQIFGFRNQATNAPSNGISHDIVPKVIPHVDAWLQTYGKNYLHWLGPQAQLVVTEPELAKEVLANKDGVYMKIQPKRATRRLVQGILLAEGEKWSKLRKIANHAFLVENLKGMVPEMIASVEMMLERWRSHEGKEIEVYQEFKLLTSEVISRTAFGSSYLEGKNIFDSLIKLGTIAWRNVFKIRFPGVGKILKSSDDIEFDKIEKGIRDSITTLMQKREENVRKGETESYGRDLLRLLLKACHENDERLRISTDEVIEECKLFYLAGQETTNGLLGWSILLLAINKDWQTKARDEVIELFGKQNPHPEGLPRLKKMNMILNETMRLYGPIVNLTRKVGKEVRLGNIILPADTEVAIPSIALQHDASIWGEDVHLFNPERFAEGVGKATNNIATAFIPFGFGNRICVGMNFAYNEVKIALAMILQRYEFTLSPTYVHSPVHLLTIRPNYGIQVILEKLY